MKEYFTSSSTEQKQNGSANRSKVLRTLAQNGTLVYDEWDALLDIIHHHDFEDFSAQRFEDEAFLTIEKELREEKKVREEQIEELANEIQVNQEIPLDNEAQIIAGFGEHF